MEQKLRDIIEKTWEYVCELKQSRRGRVIYYNQTREQMLFELLMRKVPKIVQTCSINDFVDFARFSASADSTYDDFLAKFRRFLDLKAYDFYFEVGRITNFPIGYVLGHGKLYPYSHIPQEIQKHFTAMSSLDVLPRKYDDNSWFIHVNLTAMGQHKAIENAIKIADQCISIYRLVYLTSSSPYFPEKITSPYRYVGKDRDQLLSVGYDFGEISFGRIESKDKFISDLSELATKRDKSEIESRIINALEFISLIESANPLRIKFMLCVFALERLLLSGDDREYGLRKKISEKTAFLIVRASDLISVLNYLHLDREHPPPKTLVDARILTGGRLEKIYDKRSAFAHPKTRSSEQISIYDFDFAMKVLRLVVLRLHGLSKEGITHIRKEKLALEDMQSLDVYLERLKYS